VQGAHRYIVFRNGRRVSVRTGRRFVDRTAAHGILAYTVAAEAGGRTGPQSTGRTIRYQAAPPPQADIRLTPTSTPDDPPSFWWDPVARADRYVVYRGGRPIDEIRTAGTRYTDLGVGPGVYEYQVAWMHGRTESLRSAPVRIVYEPVQPGVTPPGVTPPTGLAGTSPTADLPSLDWNAVDGADSYTVYRDNEPVGHPSEPSFTDRGIGAAGTYTYTVTATSGGVESGHSSSADIRYVPALGAPTGFSGPATFTDLPIVLTWDRVDGARGYVVSRDGAPLDEIRGTTFRDGDATPADHTYTVATVNAIGVQGDQSDPVYVTYVPPVIP
jgi:hypothetical protein